MGRRFPWIQLKVDRRRRFQDHAFPSPDTFTLSRVGRILQEAL
jgi:hypothetical protein